MDNIKLDVKNEEYILLPPTKEDIPDIKVLCYFFWEDEGIYSENFYEKLLRQNLSYIYKEKETDELIALCLALYEKKEKMVNIAVLCVKQEYQKRGLGKSILNSCIDNCIKKGYNKFYLHVMVTNESAIRLYEKVGFRKIELVKNYYSNDPPPNNDAFLMELHKKGDEGKNNGLEQTNKSGINNNTSFGHIESVNDIDDQKYNHNRDNNLSNYIMAIVVVLGIVALIVLVIIFS